MPKRETKFILKRSNVSNKIPTLGQLQLGEIALNTADVKAYAGYTGGLSGTTEIRQIGWDRLSTLSGGTVNGDVTINGDLTVNDTIRTLFLGDEQFITNNAGRAILGSTSTGFISFAGIGGVDNAGVSFKIPTDYLSGATFAVEWTMDGTSSSANTVNYNLNLTTGNTTTINEHSVIDETINIVDEAYSGTAWRILETNFSTSTLNISPEDYIHIELERNPSNVNDTMTETAYVSGIIFKYNAIR